MRISFGNVKILAVLVFASVIMPISAAHSSQIVRAAVSSLVAQAYGKAILQRYETLTGYKARTFVGPSQVAINRLMNDVSDIAITELQVSNEMKKKGYVEIPFCRDGLAIIMNKQFSPTEPSGIDNLSVKQLQMIFSGSITNWRELGGPDRKIVLVVPGEETGAFKNFSKQIMALKEVRYDFITYQAIEAIKGVQHIPGAISFVAQGAIADNEEIKIIKVDGLAPREKDYPLYQTFSFLTKGVPKGPAKAAINFGLSTWGIEIMRSKGMFPVLETSP
jgi:phosphate transport system substrate-binding protein